MLEPTIVPRWLLLRMIDRWGKRDSDQCMPCGARCPDLLATDTITFTRNNHTEVDAANVEVRMCPECRRKALGHPSTIILSDKGGLA